MALLLWHIMKCSNMICLKGGLRGRVRTVWQTLSHFAHVRVRLSSKCLHRPFEMESNSSLDGRPATRIELVHVANGGPCSGGQ
jgi:hypothetical protein